MKIKQIKVAKDIKNQYICLVIRDKFTVYLLKIWE